jgi:hypothetical protein
LYLTWVSDLRFVSEASERLMSVPLNMILGYALRMHFVHSSIRVVVPWGQQWRTLFQPPSINHSKKVRAAEIRGRAIPGGAGRKRKAAAQVVIRVGVRTSLCTGIPRLWIAAPR